jgi:hypothetical protein
MSVTRVSVTRAHDTTTTLTGGSCSGCPGYTLRLKPGCGDDVLDIGWLRIVRPKYSLGAKHSMTAAAHIERGSVFRRPDACSAHRIRVRDGTELPPTLTRPITRTHNERCATARMHNQKLSIVAHVGQPANSTLHAARPPRPRFYIAAHCEGLTNAPRNWRAKETSQCISSKLSAFDAGLTHRRRH